MISRKNGSKSEKFPKSVELTEKLQWCWDQISKNFKKIREITEIVQVICVLFSYVEKKILNALMFIAF